MNITLDATDVRDASKVDAAHREAKATEGSVTYWDETSDPQSPGWVTRVYDADGESVDLI